MNAARNPQPFTAAFTVRGRRPEIRRVVEEAERELEVAGWSPQEAQRGSAPQRVQRFVADDEWVVLVVAAPAPYRLRRTFEYELTLSGLVRDRAALHDLIAGLPFTELELELFADDMPLTASVPARTGEWLPSLELDEYPLTGHGAVFTIHHQTDFVLLLEQALALGVEPSLVTVIDKEYCYENSRRVDAHVRRRLGIPVFRYSQIDAGLSDHIRRVSAAREQSGAPTWTPTIVVDDGGYILPRLLDGFEPFLNLFKGVVEQTKSGIWKLRPYEPDLRLPIFSVAESELKATVEAQGVAAAALTSLRRLLPQEKFDGRRAVVVGFGVIGQALAELLRRQNIDVHVADTSHSMLVTARERGFQVAEDLPSLVDAVQPRYLFSCAAPGAVGADAFIALRRDCALVSLTSRDVAFDKQALAELAEPKPFGTVGTLFRLQDPARDLLLVANGFPVNFHYAESMPNQQSDLIMASLLIGAVTLAGSTPTWPVGNDPARANSVLNEGTLLRDFLRVEPGIAPGGGRR